MADDWQLLLQQRKQRIAVLLCANQSESAIDACLADVASRHVASPLLRLLGHPVNGQQVSTESLHPARSDFVVLYVVEGICSSNDDRVFCLDGLTLRQHEEHVSLGRPIKYLALFAAAAAVDGDGVEGDALQMLRVDCVPRSAWLCTARAEAVAARPSAALAHAQAVLESLQRGTGDADVDGALTSCCTWALESQQLLNLQLQRTMASAAREADALGLLEALLKHCTALRCVVDFVEGPNSVFSQLEAFARHGCDEPAALSSASVSASDTSGGGSVALQRWAQRRAALQVALHQSRADAVWASMLSPLLLQLKLQNTHRAQSLDGVVSLVEPLLTTLALVCVTCPRPSCSGSGSDSEATGSAPRAGNGSGHFLRHLVARNLIPSVAFALVKHCEALLQLETCFAVSAVADAAEQQGYVMPLCTRDAFMAKFPACAALLRRFVTFFDLIAHRVEANFSNAIPLRYRHESNDTAEPPTQRQVGGVPTVFVSIPVAVAAYAADRCDDLVAMMKVIDRAGFGMMTPQVACLFDTLHRAAVTFPVLRASEHKNWHLLTKSFEKSATLKYTEVEHVSFAASSPPPVGDLTGFDDPSTVDTRTSLLLASAAHHSTLSAAAARTPSRSPSRMSRFVDASGVSLHLNDTSLIHQQQQEHGSNIETSILREEQAVLSGRVTVLTQEITECRRLLAATQAELQAANARARTAEELNVALMAEMRGLYLRAAGAPSVPAGEHCGDDGGGDAVVRQQLVQLLADETLDASSGAQVACLEGS